MTNTNSTHTKKNLPPPDGGGGGGGKVAPYLGVTPPLSLEPPTEAEVEATGSLEAVMRELGSYETQEMCQAREKVRVDEDVMGMWV